MVIIANQSLFDIAVQEDGNVLAVFDWALKNGRSVTDILTPAEVLLPPPTVYKNVEVTGYFVGRRQRVATALSALEFQLITPAEGIGAMIIEETFEVT